MSRLNKQKKVEYIFAILAMTFIIGLLVCALIWPENSPIMQHNIDTMSESLSPYQVDVIRSDDQSAELCINGRVFIILNLQDRYIFGSLRDSGFYYMECEN